MGEVVRGGVDNWSKKKEGEFPDGPVVMSFFHCTEADSNPVIQGTRSQSRAAQPKVRREEEKAQRLLWPHYPPSCSSLAFHSVPFSLGSRQGGLHTRDQCSMGLPVPIHLHPSLSSTPQTFLTHVSKDFPWPDPGPLALLIWHCFHFWMG